MAPSLRALLANVIDYAGLFPPAKLPIDEAIRNYARYRTEPESWMLGRFICPAARMNELSTYVDELFGDGPPLAVSALGRGGADSASFVNGLRRDLDDISSFDARHESRVTVAVLETKLPQCDVDFAAAAALKPTSLAAYFEAPPAADFAKLAHALRPTGGFKLRCGGLEPAAFPTAVRIADAIVACRQARVPMKFTAGLHHPLPRFDVGIGVTMHGFINVFAAGVFAFAKELAPADVRSLVEADDPKVFRFDVDGLHWRERLVSVAEIEAARRDLVTSFGSCSFDEPRDDLRALGWL